MKLIHSDKHVKTWVHKIIRELSQDNWRPDYIVGITRGGLVPATMLSHYLDVPMHTLNISFRDNELGPESNLWMAEDAFGYVPYEGTQLPAPPDREVTDPGLRKKILIVDDINDSGRTLNWIKQDWPSGCLPDAPAWKAIWHDSVRFAVMVDNLSSGFQDVDYCGMEINKQETPCWIVFPWENWWEV
jgi:hypoxanthine phosphoribosyltransferase